MRRTALVLCLVSMITVSQVNAQNRKEEFPVNPGETIRLDLETGGTVTITGWDRNIVAISAFTDESDDYRLEMTKTGTGVSVISEYSRRSGHHSSDFDFEISAPKKFNLELDSAGGAVHIQGLEGRFEGTTGGGQITIEDAKGTVRLTTGGGQIRLEKSVLDGKVTTGGGRVLFRNVSGGVQATTGGGQIVHEGSDSSSPVKVSSPHRVVEINTGGGPINLESAPLGAEVQTGGGAITIRSAKHYVKATTGGGEIEIGSMDGSVTASTGAGDISVEMENSGASDSHDVELSSGSGDITLILPSSFSGNVDIELGYTSRHERADIISDFPLDIERTKEWEDRWGTPRKFVYGNGKIGDGKNRIRIETVNGNVYLKKAK